MKKILLTLSMAAASLLSAQYSSGVVNLSAAGMTVKLDTNATTVTITLTGDSNSMMGIGFGSSGMASGADGFIYNSSANRDYTFAGYTAPSADASQDGPKLQTLCQEVPELLWQHVHLTVDPEIFRFRIRREVSVFSMPEPVVARPLPITVED